MTMSTPRLWVSSLSLFIVLCTVLANETASVRKFEVDWDNDTFLMDGKPFSYISGSLHYFRVPHQYWRDRLRKVKLLGFNAISTYVEWSTHETVRGKYNFEGDADIVEFLKMAQEEGLYVLLRPGPYICAEREFGGFPAWLLTENPNMKFRTNDASYKGFVEEWFTEMFKHVTPMLYGNGGPVIMVQAENEYGAYPTNDQVYLAWLRDLIRNHVGDKALLYTTDQWGDWPVSRGRIPGVFTTVDFGITDDVMKNFGPLRKLQPKGPLVNSEFYPGWLSYWGDPMSRVGTQDVIKTMRKLIEAKASFNCYMIFGGTNFGFTSGSGTSGIIKLSSTSYDYDAPISEAGDLTDKYMAMRELLKELGYTVGSDEEVEALRAAPKGDYGSVTLQPVVSLLESPLGTTPVSSRYPQPMEYYNQSYGFIAYTHVVDKTTTRDPSVLKVDLRDRALILLDQVETNVLAYTMINETPLPNLKAGTKLTVLVENEGRRNYDLMNDCAKGITSKPTLDGNELQNWEVVGYPLDESTISKVEEMINDPVDVIDMKFPKFLTAKFTLPAKQTQLGDEAPLDTFLDMTNWGKGVVFINGHNLGRYWKIGPQMTLYVPGVWLNPYPMHNTITILELHSTPADNAIKFTTIPNIG